MDPKNKYVNDFPASIFDRVNKLIPDIFIKKQA
jgi:hypothetical protein